VNALVPVQTTNAEVYRASTDAAGLCKDIVLKTAQTIQGRKYVKVEGWQAIAIAHGCAASADHVERVEDGDLSGYRAVGIVRSAPSTLAAPWSRPAPSPALVAQPSPTSWS
jgi:hypothetical protein